MSNFQAFDPTAFQATPAFQTPGAEWFPNAGRVRVILSTDDATRVRPVFGSEPKVIPTTDPSVHIQRSEE